MKKNSVVKAKAAKSIHRLSELIALVVRDQRRAAMTDYLDGALHRQMLIAGALIEQCAASSAALQKGEIVPHLDICCCADTFAAILTGTCVIQYSACELPEYDVDAEDVPQPCDEPIAAATFAHLARLAPARLLTTLIDDYGCITCTYQQHHTDDETRQRQYYEAVCARLETAARYAKRIGSASARLWLQALALLQPAPTLTCGVPRGDGLALVSDCVTEAYATARRAQSLLWADVRLRELPAAKIPRIHRKKRA